MRVMVTGSNGLLGRYVMDAFRHGFVLITPSRSELDVTDLDACIALVDQYRPDLILNLAAYTAVDKAEREVDQAFAVNAYGARNVAIAGDRVGAKVCYISSDYVFDGGSPVPYNEFDTTNPQSVYGKSKRAGEMMTAQHCSRFFIVRTSWLYGQMGRDFVSTMLKLGKEKEQLKVVNDQWGSPTFAKDLAVFLRELVVTEKYGTYHVSNSGHTTWYEFAREVFRIEGLSVKVDPCNTQEFLRPAPRPAFSAMEHQAIRLNGFEPMRNWNDALREYLVEQLEGERYGDRFV